MRLSPEARYFAPCLVPYSALSFAAQHLLSVRETPPSTELPPTIAPQADILKAGAAGIEGAPAQGEARAGAGDVDGCCCRAKLHLLDFDILGTLV